MLDTSLGQEVITCGLYAAFFGTGEQLIAKAYKDSKLSGREYERVVNYVKSILEYKYVNQFLEEEGYI